MRPDVVAWVVAILVASVLLGVDASTAAASTPAKRPLTRVAVTAAAARYGGDRGFHVGVAVYDRKTGRTYTAGHATGEFATESVVKVFIAARLLVDGEMTGSTAATAYKMITQSDDASADALYGRVGGDGLINWARSYFHVPDLGAPPSHAGWWGNTHITPRGLVRVYAKLAADRRVGPWLLNAMHHARRYGSDGTYQYFGLRSANSHAAIKQGWGCEFTSGCAEADFNSTGFVDRDRYAVALLARGPLSTYGRSISSVLTGMARRLLPGGAFPLPPPVVTRLSTARAAAHGGTRVVIHGTNLSATSWVAFGRIHVHRLAVLSSHRIAVTAPRHDSGRTHVRVHTRYGISDPGKRAEIQYIEPPKLSHMSSRAVRTRGGDRITVLGHHFVDVSTVRVGSATAKSVHVKSPRVLTFETPRHAAGSPHVRVVTRYGTSPLASGRFRYVAPSAIKTISPATTTTDATPVTITGANFTAVRSVDFDGVTGTHLHAMSDDTLHVTAPAHAAGDVAVRVVTRFGTSRPVTLTYTGAPQIATTTLPNGTVGQPYSATLDTLDHRPGTWAISQGQLPDGLALDGAEISGTPTMSGTANLMMTFTDSFGRTASSSFQLQIG